MSNEFGNASLALPGTGQVAEKTPGDIVASTVGFAQKGVTLLSGQGILPAGTVLARQTSTKKYVLYDNGGSGGAEIAVGILAERTDTTDGDCAGNMIIGGILKYSHLSGLDSAGITDLNGRTDTNRDWFKF